MEIIWTDYMRYRAELRGFDLRDIEHILLHGNERYNDAATGRRIAVGIGGSARLLMIPFEQDGENLIPVTVHVTTRQQVSLRVKTGRFTHE